FSDITHDHWLAEKKAHMSTVKPAGNIPIVCRDQLGSGWRASKPLVVIGVHSELDEAGAVALANLAEIHGIATRIERPTALRAANLASLDLSDAALICLSSISAKTPSHIHYAVRRVRSRTPHAKLLLGIWSAKDDNVLTGLKKAVEVDFVVRSFRQALV